MSIIIVRLYILDYNYSFLISPISLLKLQFIYIILITSVLYFNYIKFIAQF